MIRFIRLPAVAEALGCSGQEVYRRIRRGLVPQPIKRGRVSLWVEGDLARVLEAEATGADEAALRELERDIQLARGADLPGGQAAQARTRTGRFKRTATAPEGRT